MKFADLRSFLYPNGFGFNQFTLMLSLLVIVSGLWVFIALTDEVMENEQLSYDQEMLKLMRTGPDNAVPVGPDWLPDKVKDISALGSTPVLFLVVASVTGFLLLRRRYQSALLILVATGVGVLVVASAKEWLARPRPDIIPHLVAVSSQSYPSGHTTMSAVVYLSLAAMLAQLQQRKRIKIYSIGIALMLTFLVGLSRVYLGVHYPSDVLAGWAFGLAWASLCWMSFDWLGNKYLMSK
ncbi:MAG TPA: phosphatase PAP2 family protein [Fodinibius sp.]|nr:phosphatase PAP2 family protein [Fodinibius sp.]